MPTASRQLAQEVLETVLTDHERNLLRTAAHSIQRAVGLYGRQHGGQAGVEAEVERVKEKVERALGARMQRDDRVRSVAEAASDIAGDEIRIERVRDGREFADVSGPRPAEVLPVARLTPEPRPAPATPRESPSGRNGNVNGAGAAGSSVDDPPTAAPASSFEKFERPSPSPARRDGLQDRVLELLRAQRMTPKRLAAELGTDDRSMKARVVRMQGRGLIERTEENAYDWPGGGPPGRPGRVWRLAEESEGVLGPLRPARSTAVKPWRPREESPATSNGNGAAPALCGHGEPHTECARCQPPLDGFGSATAAEPAKLVRCIECGMPAPTHADGCSVLVVSSPQEPQEPQSPKEFDPAELWGSLTDEQRAKLLLHVLTSHAMLEKIVAAALAPNVG